MSVGSSKKVFKLQSSNPIARIARRLALSNEQPRLKTSMRYQLLQLPERISCAAIKHDRPPSAEPLEALARKVQVFTLVQSSRKTFNRRKPNTTMQRNAKPNLWGRFVDLQTLGIQDRWVCPVCLGLRMIRPGADRLHYVYSASRPQSTASSSPITRLSTSP